MSRSILIEGIDPESAVKYGLMAAMEKVGEVYACETYYTSRELLLCADALHMRSRNTRSPILGTNLTQQKEVSSSGQLKATSTTLERPRQDSVRGNGMVGCTTSGKTWAARGRYVEEAGEGPRPT